MNWNELLQPGESLCWQGRPAPRCYTFRRWPHTLFGLLLLPLSLVWAWGGAALAETHSGPLWILLPWVAIIVSLWFVAGHLIWARLVWGRLFFALTDRRLLVYCGWPRVSLRQLPLAEINWFRVMPHGSALGSLLVTAENAPRPLSLPCLEHPEPLIAALRAAVTAQETATC